MTLPSSLAAVLHALAGGVEIADADQLRHVDHRDRLAAPVRRARRLPAVIGLGRRRRRRAAAAGQRVHRQIVGPVPAPCRHGASTPAASCPTRHPDIAACHASLATLVHRAASRAVMAQGARASSALGGAGYGMWRERRLDWVNQFMAPRFTPSAGSRATLLRADVAESRSASNGSNCSWQRSSHRPRKGVASNLRRMEPDRSPLQRGLNSAMNMTLVARPRGSQANGIERVSRRCAL